MQRLCPQLTALSLLVLLTGCFDVAPGPPSRASFGSDTIELSGVLSKSVQVDAAAEWEIGTGNNSWLSASPSSGVGSATVQLNVNPSNLLPNRYNATISLVSEGEDSADYAEVIFSFPRLRGNVVLGETTNDGASLLAAEPLPNGPGTLLVSFHEPANSDFSTLAAESFETLANSLAVREPGIRHEASYSHTGTAAYQVNNMRRAAAELLRDPNVRSVSPNSTYSLLGAGDPRRDEQWALDLVRAEEAWPTTKGAGVIVAVIDAGFDPDHPDLTANILGTYDAYETDDPANPVTTLKPRAECGFHGNHVAGIIAAETNDQGIAGIAPEADLLLINAAGDDAGCPINTQSVINAINWIIAGDRAQVINMSFGGPSSNDALDEVLEKAYAAGITLVAASGNSFSSGVYYPAATPEVIAVSATGRDDTIASYSTVGPEIFVSAPGGDGSDYILSTFGTSSSDPYAYMQGTSMASPAAAGVAALVRAANGSLSPLGVAGVLAASSVDKGDPAKDDDYGYGRVDALQAVTEATSVDASAAGFILTAGSATEFGVPVDHQFDIGYVAPGTVTLEVGSDDNRDGVPHLDDAYYGSATVTIPNFEGPYTEAKVTVTPRAY